MKKYDVDMLKIRSLRAFFWEARSYNVRFSLNQTVELRTCFEPLNHRERFKWENVSETKLFKCLSKDEDFSKSQIELNIL